MYRCYILDPERMQNREAMRTYMEELFGFVNDYDAVNLDALSDSLSEVTADTDLILTPLAVRAVCRNEFAYKVLLVLGKAAEENPHLHLLFRDGEE